MKKNLTSSTEVKRGKAGDVAERIIWFGTKVELGAKEHWDVKAWYLSEKQASEFEYEMMTDGMDISNILAFGISGKITADMTEEDRNKLHKRMGAKSKALRKQYLQKEAFLKEHGFYEK
jgi:hypothetical protein